MCITPLPHDSLDNLKKFRYKSSDDSLLYNHIISPCLNKVVNYLPVNLAPNVITITSLLCNIIAFSLTVYDVGSDFSKTMTWYTCLVQGIAHFFYLMLDNIDGKQARRTGTSSPFGMLLDHGCDVFTNCFTAFNLSHLYVVGNSTFFSFSVFIGLFIGFFTLTYEELIVGEMHFWYINGTDEGNMFVSLMGIVCAIAGQEFLFNSIGPFTIGEYGCMLVLVGMVTCIVGTFVKIFKARGFKGVLIIFLDWIFVYNIILFPLFILYLDNEFYQEHCWLIMLCSSLLFSRITIDLQIKIVTMDKQRLSIFIILSNTFQVMALFINLSNIKFYFLSGVAMMQGTELMMFVLFRSKEISAYLGIKIFTIAPANNAL